jgi:hypothetical protein
MGAKNSQVIGIDIHNLDPNNPNTGSNTPTNSNAKQNQQKENEQMLQIIK